jgi:hypothetical protein
MGGEENAEWGSRNPSSSAVQEEVGGEVAVRGAEGKGDEAVAVALSGEDGGQPFAGGAELGERQR